MTADKQSNGAAVLDVTIEGVGAMKKPDEPPTYEEALAEKDKKDGEEKKDEYTKFVGPLELVSNGVVIPCDCQCLPIIIVIIIPSLYSVSPSPGSDVVRLFAKRSLKSCAPSEIAHTSSHVHKNKECVHMLTSCVCMLTSLPGDGETDGEPPGSTVWTPSVFQFYIVVPRAPFR